MRYGFYLPTRGGCASPEAIEAIVQRGEALGFHSVMIADHVVFPTAIASKYPYTVSGAFPGGGDALEQLTLMAFVAGRTRTLRLVTSVMILPIATRCDGEDAGHRRRAVARPSDRGRGRGLAPRGVRGARSPDFDRRGAASDEYLRIFKMLWTENPASFKGEFYRFSALRCLPQPVQTPHPPIWIGGHSTPALRRVARHGDGWHPVGANPAVPLRPAELQASLDQLFRMTEAEGRDPSDLTISFKAPVYDASVTTLGGPIAGRSWVPPSRSPTTSGPTRGLG